MDSRDRCDKCQARAYYLAHKNELDLLFCLHHGNRYMEQLILQGFTIVDETDDLFKAEAGRNPVTV